MEKIGNSSLGFTRGPIVRYDLPLLAAETPRLETFTFKRTPARLFADCGGGEARELEQMENSNV